VADSHEHTEDGHITEDADVRIRMVNKRLRKEQGMAVDAVGPELYGPKRADRLLICWGSTYGPCREATDLLNARGGSTAMLHFAQVWPINIAAVRRIVESVGAKQITCIEANATGQFASVLRSLGLVDECDTMLKYDSRPFTAEEIASRFES
jgi:2-oxoglutarate ferredoxin oxidoreductase subunit alpha